MCVKHPHNKPLALLKLSSRWLLLHNVTNLSGDESGLIRIISDDRPTLHAPQICIRLDSKLLWHHACVGNKGDCLGMMGNAWLSTDRRADWFMTINQHDMWKNLNIFDGLNRFCLNFQSVFSPIKYFRVVNSDCVIQHRDDKSANFWNPDRDAEISSAADTCSGFFDLLLHLYLFLQPSVLCFLRLSLVADHIPDDLKQSYFPRCFQKQLLLNTWRLSDFLLWC